MTPFLKRLRDAQAEREAQRKLREEQEQAFALTAEQDRQRILKKMEEEKRAREEYEMQEMVRLVEEAERKRAMDEREERERNRLLWYRYARRCLLKPEPALVAGGDTIRIGVRLPDGSRHVRHFEPADSVTSLYIFVASQLIPTNLSPSDDPMEPPAGFQAGEEGITEEAWSFKLALSYPRQELNWAPKMSLSSISALRGGAQVVVESVSDRSLVPGSVGQPAGDSDYESEED